MNRYQKAKVYRIVSNHTDEVYIGSTCNPLSKRIAKHKDDYRRHLAGKFNRVTSFDILQHGDAIIILIEDYPCESKEQLLARERFHIENTPNCVNRNIPGRTNAEYYEAHKAEIAEWQKTYHEAHKAEQAERMKAYYVAHKEESLERIKAYHEVHKVEISEKRKQIVECECGFTVTKSNITTHRKSDRHAIAMAQLAEQEV